MVEPTNTSELVSLLTNYFNKSWAKYLHNAPSDGDMVADLSDFLGHIKDMKLQVNPVTGPTFSRLVVDGWEYVGPGDLNLNVYFDVDHYGDLPIDHYLVAQEVLIPWIQNSFLKYFGLNIFTDFADIVIGFYVGADAYDEYDISVSETNTKMFYANPPKYWRKTDKKNNLKESVIEEGLLKTKSLYLTFPKKGWETIGAYLMKVLGIVTGVFTSSEDAVNVVRKKKKRMDLPLKEVVIGSHGDGQNLLMSQGSKGLPVDGLLSELKGVVGPDTTIFFTACYGADFLFQLCHASAKLGGNKVHGAAGVYNYITNSADKGYYSCQMSPTEYYDIQNDYNKRNIIFGSENGNKYLIDKGFCQRESSAPINWVKNIWT